MIAPANRIAQTGEYYFSKKLKEIKKLQEDGQDIINLGIGNPDMLPSEPTLKALSDELYKSDAHGYQPYKGIDALRQAFSKWYKNIYNVNIDSETEVLPLIGSKEGILHISMAFLNPGDKVLIPDPAYPTYQSVSKLIGAEIIRYPLIEENDWAPDLNELEKLDLNEVKIMWVNYPNMPTGARAQMHVMEQLIAFGQKNNIIICNDNPYSLVLNEEPTSILSIKGAKEIAIELNSLSKSHNMAGWRMGMLASNPEFIQHILTVKSNMDSGIFKPLQMAAIAALNCPQEWYSKQNLEYSSRKKIAKEILNDIGCIYNDDQVGMFIWARIPEHWESAELFSEHLLRKCKVFITPGFIFGKQGKNFIRISLSNNTTKLLEVKNRINKLVNIN